MKAVLHICCGVCAAGAANVLLSEGHEVTGYYYNPTTRQYFYYNPDTGQYYYLNPGYVPPNNRYNYPNYGY